MKPLLELKEAVDHAASGDYLIDFELRGEGEVVELAKSVRKSDYARTPHSLSTSLPHSSTGHCARPILY